MPLLPGWRVTEAKHIQVYCTLSIAFRVFSCRTNLHVIRYDFVYFSLHKIWQNLQCRSNVTISKHYSVDQCKTWTLYCGLDYELFHTCNACVIFHTDTSLLATACYLWSSAIVHMLTCWFQAYITAPQVVIMADSAADCSPVTNVCYQFVTNVCSPVTTEQLQMSSAVCWLAQPHLSLFRFTLLDFASPSASTIPQQPTCGGTATVNTTPKSVPPVFVSQIPNVNPFYVNFISGNIRVCQGCKGSLHLADYTVPLPPFDLTISCVERQQFRDNKGNLVTLPRFEQAAHYHLSINCIKAGCRTSVHNLKLASPTRSSPKVECCTPTCFANCFLTYSNLLLCIVLLADCYYTCMCVYYLEL